MPEISDPIRDYLDANKPFSDKIKPTGQAKSFGEDVWEGPLSNGRPDGYGKMYKDNGDLYIGNFENGKASGPGHYIFANGDHYQGEFKNNQAETEKGYYYSDNLEYKGGFSDNTFHGKGSEKGRKHEFDGEYKHGKRVRGCFKWDTVPNNDVYEYIYDGEFDENGKFTGKGKLQEIKGTY